MAKRWLTWTNYALGIVILLLIGGAFLLNYLKQEEIALPDVSSIKPPMPKNAFAKDQKSYDAISEPLVSLSFSPLSTLLPDLRRYLIYYGKNGRPDAPQRPLLHFAFTGNKALSSVHPGEKLFLFYDRKLNPPQYVFSPDNTETSFWIEATPLHNEAAVRVSMKNDAGQIIREPQAYAQFNLPEKEYVRFGGVVWELGKFRVDATLLARQRARWYGPDLFLQKHGGPEYQEIAGKQRIDFGEGEEVYSLYAGLGDTLVWKDDRWKQAKPGQETLGMPLMVVKKIEERLLTLELWDIEGKGKITLNLLKSTEPSPPVNVQQSFKFLGARTRSQFVFDINKQRMLLSPRDWLLLGPKGWKKLVTPQEIDDYVDRKTTGVLFVFDGIEKKGEQLVLKGTVFNAARTDMQSIELPIQQSIGLMKPRGEGNGKAPSPNREMHTPNMPASSTNAAPVPMIKGRKMVHPRSQEVRRRMEARDEIEDEDDDDDDDGDFDDDDM
jgi:hypothetical protein